MSTAAVDQQLQWESRYRVRAGAVAIVGAILTIAGYISLIATLSTEPAPSFLGSLSRVEQPGGIGGQPSLLLPQWRFLADHGTGLIVSYTLIGLGAVASMSALVYLAVATRSRSDRFPPFAVYLPVVGGALTLIGALAFSIGQKQLADANVAGAGTVDAIRTVAHPAAYYAGQIIQFIGAFVLGAAFILVSLNAMRVGLLTRFMGIIGVIAGVLTAVPILGPVGLVLEPLWLLGVGAVVLGYWPSGVPPAWRTGKAEPWPSAADVREQRQAGQQRRRGVPAPVAAEGPPAEPAAPARPHPSSKKRKRKRRS